MALLDIVIDGYQVELEENRGDTGAVTDMVIEYNNETLVEVPQVVGGGFFEYGFGYIG